MRRKISRIVRRITDRLNSRRALDAQQQIIPIRHASGLTSFCWIRPLSGASERARCSRGGQARRWPGADQADVPDRDRSLGCMAWDRLLRPIDGLSDHPEMDAESSPPRAPGHRSSASPARQCCPRQSVTRKRTDMPVVIIGTQRSGSNPLRLMRNLFPGIAAPHPPRIMASMAPLRSRYGDLADDVASVTKVAVGATHRFHNRRLKLASQASLSPREQWLAAIAARGQAPLRSGHSLAGQS